MLKNQRRWTGNRFYISMFALLLLGGSLDRHGWKLNSANLMVDGPIIIVMLLFFSLLTFLISKN